MDILLEHILSIIYVPIILMHFLYVLILVLMVFPNFPMFFFTMFPWDCPHVPKVHYPKEIIRKAAAGAQPKHWDGMVYLWFIDVYR